MPVTVTAPLTVAGGGVIQGSLGGGGAKLMYCVPAWRGGAVVGAGFHENDFAVKGRARCQLAETGAVSDDRVSWKCRSAANTRGYGTRCRWAAGRYRARGRSREVLQQQITIGRNLKRERD